MFPLVLEWFWHLSTAKNSSLNYAVFANSDETGTKPSNAVKAAVLCGFDAYQAQLTFEELKDLVSQNITPIVFTKAFEIARYSHAVVVYKILKNKILVLDPENGECEIELNLFAEIWSRNSAIIIEKIQ